MGRGCEVDAGGCLCRIRHISPVFGFPLNVPIFKEAAFFRIIKRTWTLSFLSCRNNIKRMWRIKTEIINREVVQNFIYNVKLVLDKRKCCQKETYYK